jgi:DNA-binding HxlR family transcriptional regulator
MQKGPTRLGQLRRQIPGASKKLLTQHLRKLEADGLVIRNDLSNVILHVEYDFAPSVRESICSVLNALT